MKSRASARSPRVRKSEDVRRSARPRRPARPFTENYREILELAPVGIFSSTPAGRFLVVNQAFARMLGYDSAAELLRVDISRDLYFDPADRQKLREDFEKSSGIVRWEALLKKKDGSPLSVSFDGRVVRDAKGRAVGYQGFVHDITERKRAEEAQRASEERFRALVENSAEVTGLVDREGRWLYVSSSVRRLLGFDPEEILAMGRFGTRVHPDDLPGLSERFRALVEGSGGTDSYEFRGRRKDGVWRLFEVVGDNRLSDPNVGAVVMNYRDITEKKRAEEQLRRSEERFRALVENSHEVVSLFDREGRWLYISPSVQRIWGYTPEEMLATKSFGERVHPDDREAVLKKFHALVASPDAIARVEFRALHKDGSWRDIEAVTVNRFDDPAIGAIVANLRDITERRRADEQRAAILERVSDAFVALDKDWRYVYLNEKAAQIFGRTREELIGKHIWTEFPEGVGQPFYKAYYRAAESQTPIELEEYYPPYDRWFENRIYPSPDGLSIFFRDITERKQAEEKLRRAYQEHRALAARMETVREEEASRIAREFHDEIGQALTAIKLQLQTLQRHAGAAAFAEELGEGLQIAERAIEAVRSLSQDLRPAVLDDLGLPAALRWHLDRQAQLAGFKAELSALLPPGRLSRELETACFRVVQEAVTNVVRHARASRVRVDLALDGTALLLAVQDDGVGFDVAAAQARARGGQSLGILGMEERVSQLGGSFSIDSNSSEGTRICVRLPFAAAPPADSR